MKLRIVQGRLVADSQKWLSHWDLGRRLPFWRESGLFVGAGSPGGGYGDIEEAQVDTELAAVLIPVIEHDVAEELRARDGQEFGIAAQHAPGFLHAGIVELRQQGSDRRDTLVVRGEDFAKAGRLRNAGEIGGLLRVLLNEADNASWHAGEMQSELAGGHRFCVRLPGEFVFRQAFEEFAGKRGLGFKFGEDGFC